MNRQSIRLCGSLSLILLWFLVGSATSALAQGSGTTTTGSVRGGVKDQTGQPIEGAVITVRQQGKRGVAVRAVTDRQGNFWIGALDPGYYVVTATCSQCEPSSGDYFIPNLLLKTEHNVIRWPHLTLIRTSIATAPLDPHDAPASCSTVSNLVPVFFTGSCQPVGSNEPRPGQSPAAPPVPPEPGLLSEDTTLSELVETQSATRGGIFNRRELLYLPLPGIRSFDNLALLLPGVAPPPETLGSTAGPGIGAGIGTPGEYSVNGIRSRANNFVVDGSDNNDQDVGVRRQGFTALVPQTVESLEEFHVMTLLPGVQFGRNMGAQANAISRSGRDRLHGTVYGFFTDSHLNARGVFDTGSDSATISFKRSSDGAPVLLNGSPLTIKGAPNDKTPYDRTENGAAIGGRLPVLNGTYFFASFEDQVVRSQTRSHYAVPTIAQRGLFGKGDTGLTTIGLDENGNPLKSVPIFPTSVVGDALFSLFPFPNNPAGPYGPNTFTELSPSDATGFVGSTRIDHPDMRILRGSSNLSATYSATHDDTDVPAVGGALFSGVRASVQTQDFSVILDSIFSKNFVNQARFSYGRTALGFKEIRDPFLEPSNALPGQPFLLNAPIITNVTLPGGPTTLIGGRGGPSSEGTTGPLGQVLVSGFSPVGLDVHSFPQGRANNTYQYADTIFYSSGKHTIAAGFDVRRDQLNSFMDNNFRPLAQFNGAPDLVEEKKLSISDTKPFVGTDFVAAGAPTGLSQTLATAPDSTIGLRYWETNFFLGDQVRVNPGLTLTVGLRYQLNTVPTEVNNRIDSSLNSPEVAQFIKAELDVSPNTLNPNSSGLQKFLAGRTSIYKRDASNIAPHVAFAWSPGGKGRLSIRGGYGVYFDQILGSVISESRNVFPRFININEAGHSNSLGGSVHEFQFFNPQKLAAPGTLNAADPTTLLSLLLGPGNLIEVSEAKFLKCLCFCDGFSKVFTTTAAPDFVLPSNNLLTPYSEQWGLTAEAEIPHGFLVSIGYIGTRGVHLLRLTTPNGGPNVIPLIFSVGVGASGAEPVFKGLVVDPSGAGIQLGSARPFPLLGSLTSIESSASSTFHSLQAQLNKRFSHGIEFTTSYTWSHAIDDVSDLFDLAGAPALPQDGTNLRLERGNASFDIRHRFVYSFIWNLPGRGHGLLNDWQVSSIGSFQSGQPYTVLASVDQNLDGNLTDRLDSTKGIVAIRHGATQLSFPPDLLALLAMPGSDGSVGRNTFRAPFISSIDLAVNKRLSFRERHQLNIRVEIFNLFNRPDFGIPVHVLGFPSLGSSVSTRLPARVIQFSLKYIF